MEAPENQKEKSGLLSKIKNILFKKKGEEEKTEKEVKELQKQERKVIGTCSYCNQPIYEDEKYNTIEYNNQKYLVHVKCLRKAKKQAFDVILGDKKL